MASGRINDFAIAALLLCVSAIWGTTYWNRSFQSGRQPVFYQDNFEPAVLAACGHGFLLADPPVPAVQEFLAQRTDRITCDQIPQDQPVTDRALFQKSWLYLMRTVEMTWRLLGISWSGMGPLFGLLFGVTIAASYSIFRFGMNRFVSVAGAILLAVSTVHLRNLPDLRDYAKAPLMLGLMALLMAIVSGPATWRRLLLISATYGLVLGIGYGFRTDFLIEIPVFFVVLFVFLEGGWLRNLPRKLTASAVCTAVFLATAWPVISAVRTQGGCQWHAMLLGLSDRFTEELMVVGAPYTLVHAYSDGLVYSETSAYAQRVQPGTGHVGYCSPAYDTFSGRYLATLAATFPADILTRLIASITQVARVPFRWLDAPLPGFAEPLFSVRRQMLRAFRGTGLLFIAAALLILLAINTRVGLFGVFLFVYCFGYPMLQFDVRHYFHLEVLTWWAIGFVGWQARRLWPAGDRQSALRTGAGGRPLRWKRAVATLGAIGLLFLASLLTLRWQQQRSTERLFNQYVAAPREPIAIGEIANGVLYPLPLRDHLGGEPFPVDVVEVEMDSARCSAEASITFQYHEPGEAFTHRLTVGTAATPGSIRFFEPVYWRFDGVRFDGVGPGCVRGMYRMAAPDRLPVLVSVRLEPGWENGPRYQRVMTPTWSDR